MSSRLGFRVNCRLSRPWWKEHRKPGAQVWVYPPCFSLHLPRGRFSRPLQRVLYLFTLPSIRHISVLLDVDVLKFSYEVRKGVYSTRGFKKMDSVTMASLEASLISTLITQPMSVIKTRMVLNVHKDITEHQNFKEQVRELYRQHGLKGFLKGLQLSLILSSTGVVQMYLYEGAKTLY